MNGEQKGIIGEPILINGIYIGRSQSGHKWFHVKVDDLKPIYDRTFNFVDSFQSVGEAWTARVIIEREDEDKTKDWFHISLNGEPLYPERYEFVDFFYEGLARARQWNGKWLYISPDGSPAFEGVVFDAAHSFKNGKAEVLNGEKWTTISAAMKFVAAA
ncbi:MAG: WG repeat-containing protein [Patescibacteria group bacterium]